MKTATLSALAVIAVAASAFAGPKDFKQTASQQFFKDTEITLDAFYSYNDGKHQDPGYADLIDNDPCIIKPQYLNDGSGGGVGVNYFFARYFGVGVEGNWWNGARDGMSEETHDKLVRNGKVNSDGEVDQNYKKSVAHQISGDLILRYPMEFCTFGLAPYIIGGGGVITDGSSVGFGDVGAGVEVRFTPSFGVFTDWRWNFVAGDKNDVNTTRAGLRFVF